MNTSWNYSNAHNRYNFTKSEDCYEGIIQRIHAHYPGAVVIRPNRWDDWLAMCEEHALKEEDKVTKNDRSNCFSAVVVTVSKDGHMCRRRATRWVCGTVGGFSGYRAGNLNTSIEREYYSLTFCRQWLSPIARVIFADISIIEGCKGDLSLAVHGSNAQERLCIQVSQLTYTFAGEYCKLGHTFAEVEWYLENGMPFLMPIMAPAQNPEPDAAYIDCGFFLLMPADLDRIRKFDKASSIHLNPFAFYEHALNDNTWNVQLGKNLVLWRNIRTGKFSPDLKRRGMRQLQAVLLYHILGGTARLYTDEELVALSPILKQRELAYLKWFQELLRPNHHSERRVWRQGDLEVLLPSQKICVMEFKSFDHNLQEFAMRHQGGQPYNPNTVHVLTVVKMNDMQVVESVLYPLRTADGQYNLVNRMATSLHIGEDMVIAGMRYPYDRLVISNGQPFDTNNFNETLQSWVKRKPIVWELTDEEKNVIQAEKATLNNPADVVVEVDMMNDFYEN